MNPPAEERDKSANVEDMIVRGRPEKSSFNARRPSRGRDIDKRGPAVMAAALMGEMQTGNEKGGGTIPRRNIPTYPRGMEPIKRPPASEIPGTGWTVSVEEIHR